ncbi:MAG: SRPBCC family protein [Cyanobacteria bacterium J06638_20]
MLSFWCKPRQHNESGWVQPLVQTFYAASTASVDMLWQKVTNLADVSWHPIIASTNVPNGLIPKPGLIYRAVTRRCPIPVRVFVERVLPREMLSVRIFALPGIEERVTYRVESTLCGTQVTYSVTLRGWFSPLVWSFLRPYAARVAKELVQAAERAEAESGVTNCSRPKYPDMFAGLVLALGLGTALSTALMQQMPGAIAPIS